MIDLDVHLEAISSGDADAFGTWMIQAEPSLRRSLRSFARSVDVEAVVQEALLRTWQVAPKISSDGRPNSLLRMSGRIARNLAVSETRRRRHAAVESEAVVQVSPHSPDPLLRRVIQRCREKLPKQPAAALMARLSAQAHTSDGRLAEELSMTKNTFLQNFGRARKLLAACLEKNGVVLREVIS
ncbi:MAG: sigma-70 family RNA polymerase sigma factor [Myxococcota bacterium]